MMDIDNSTDPSWFLGRLIKLNKSSDEIVPGIYLITKVESKVKDYNLFFTFVFHFDRNNWRETLHNNFSQKRWCVKDIKEHIEKGYIEFL